MNRNLVRYLGCLVLLVSCTSPRGTVQKDIVEEYRGQLPHYAGPQNDNTQSFPDMSAYDASTYEYLNAAFSEFAAGQSKMGHQRLNEAADIAASALGYNPHSRASAEALGVIYFYQGYYGQKDGMNKSIAFLTSVLDVDGYSEQSARYLANAYNHKGDTGSAIYYADYVQAVSTDVGLVQEMESLKGPIYANFLSGWFAYQDFYSSDAAVVKQYNKSTYKFEDLLRVTPDLERQWGEKAFQQMKDAGSTYGDASVQQYVQSIVDKLVISTPGPPFNYQVEVLDAVGVNAWASPGRIVVNKGLLQFVENEAELATILSHELAHIYAHHMGRALVSHTSNQRTAGALLSLIKIDNVDHQKLVDTGLKVGLDLLKKGFSRSQEAEADRYGTHIAFNAGYNPTFMTSFFVKLYEANPKSPFRLLATHPATSDRIENTSGYLENFPLNREMQIDSQAFKDMKMKLY